MAHVSQATVGTAGSGGGEQPLASPPPPTPLPPPPVAGDEGGGSDSDGISPARSGDSPSLVPPSPSGSSASASSFSASSSSSSSDGEGGGGGRGGGGAFRRLDSDDGGEAVTGRLGRFTRGRGLGGARAAGLAGARGGRPAPPTAGVAGRAGRLAESSKARVRDALLAHDPGGYKRALADKHALAHIFSGLDALGAAVFAARADGREDVAFVLDDDRRNARRALDEALALPDEAAALDRIRGVEAAIEASLEVAAASAEEAAAARAAAHAALPVWKRVWDLDKDGEVSLKEKRHWVTGVLLLVTAIGCLVLMGLLTRSYVEDHRDPSVVLTVTERAQVVLPPFTFCMPGPAFATINQTNSDGSRIAPYTGFLGKPLFLAEWLQLPTPTGGEAVPRDNAPFNLAPGTDGQLIELPGPRTGCANSDASLSPDSSDTCFSCYEMWQQHTLYGGGTVEANLRSTIDLAFLTYAPYTACLANPDELLPEVVAELRGVIEDAFDTLISREVLRKPLSEPDIVAENLLTLNSSQLCNIVFFSGVFYPLLRDNGGAAYDRQSTADGTIWVEATPLSSFLVGRHIGSGDALDLHILPAVTGANTAATAREATVNQGRSHATLPGIPVGAALPGELTQVLLTKRIFDEDVQGVGSARELRYEARVEGYPRVSLRPESGYSELEISIALETFLIESFTREAHYTFVQFLEQITGYTANFFDISVFTLIVVPILFAFHRRDQARAEAAAAAAAADAVETPRPSSALGDTPTLTPMTQITPGASSFYGRRRLPSSGEGGGNGGGGAGSGVGGVGGGGMGAGPGGGGGHASGSIASELAAAAGSRSLGGMILRFGARGNQGAGGRQRGGARPPADSSDDDVV